uniref:Uncharacterized protein n=1 Tax=Oryza nivara TaxID=4536 RepID=A0A0E0GU04_ORYNI
MAVRWIPRCRSSAAPPGGSAATTSAWSTSVLTKSAAVEDEARRGRCCGHQLRRGGLARRGTARSRCPAGLTTHRNGREVSKSLPEQAGTRGATSSGRSRQERLPHQLRDPNPRHGHRHRRRAEAADGDAEAELLFFAATGNAHAMFTSATIHVTSLPPPPAADALALILPTSFTSSPPWLTSSKAASLTTGVEICGFWPERRGGWQRRPYVSLHNSKSAQNVELPNTDELDELQDNTSRSKTLFE